MDEESTESEWESAEVEEDNEDKGEVEKSTTDVDKSGCAEVVASAVDIKGTGLSDSVFFVVVLCVVCKVVLMNVWAALVSTSLVVNGNEMSVVMC